MLGVFVCLNIIQFAVGSYIEPRVAGTMLSISPVVVLFAILFWIADLLGGPEPAKAGKLARVQP